MGRTTAWFPYLGSRFYDPCRYSSWFYRRTPLFYPVYPGTSTYVYNNYTGYQAPSNQGVYYDDYDYDVQSYADAYGSTSTLPNVWSDSSAVAVVPGSTASAGQRSSSPIYTHTDVGLTTFYNGEFDLARREFVRAVLASPDDPETLLLYGYAHYATGDYLVSSLAVRKALKGDPTLIDSPIDLVGLYSSPELFERHFNRLNAYLADHPDDEDAWFLAAYVQYASGLAEAAAGIFDGQLRAKPNDTLVWLLRDAAVRVAEIQQRERAADSTAPAGRPSEPVQWDTPGQPPLSEPVPGSLPTLILDDDLPPEAI